MINISDKHKMCIRDSYHLVRRYSGVAFIDETHDSAGITVTALTGRESDGKHSLVAGANIELRAWEKDLQVDWPDQ